MARVILINPPSEKGYIRSGRWTRRTRARQNWMPIWLSYATSLLEREGHDCLLIDASVDELNTPQTIAKLFDFRPDYIAVYWGYDTCGQDLRFAGECSRFAKVVLVGPWSFCLPNAMKKIKSLNLMTFGEFEHTLLEIVEGKHPSKIKGLIWKEGDEVIKNEGRSLCSSEEFTKFPFVTDVYKRFLNIKKYRQTSLKFPFVDLQTARGCSHRCSYCVMTRAIVDGEKYRTRDIKNVIEELWWIKENLPEVKQVFFQDETLPFRRALEISQAILDENLDIYWGALARAELDYETLKMMEESGCRTLQVGFEKPIQKHLDTIHKDITVERMEQFCHDINKTKIWNNAAFMIFPWETPNDIKFTLNWAKEMKIDRLSFIRAIPYPNTPYADTVKEFGKNQKLMTIREMESWEKWAHKQYYIYHPWMWWQLLKRPSNWGNVFSDALGLLGSLR